MKCILMNKNTEVLVAEYNNISKFFDEIIEIRNIDYAPLILKNKYKNCNEDEFKVALSNWFKGRGIPSWRDKLDLLLVRLNITSQEELLDKAFGLSLSDQYWIKPFEINITHDDINFFDHDFDASPFLEASFSNNSKIILEDNSLKTPNNTTDGMLMKSWIIEKGKRFLIKGGFKNDILQPFNEFLASDICERLGFEHVKYTLDIVNNKVVSKCACFIDKNTELITAYQIMDSAVKHQDLNDYYDYIEILKSNGIKNAKEKLENMYILDFLIMNEDRHLNNFGIIRDVNTLEWLDVAPIFDNGQSLNVVSYDSDEILLNGEGRLFYTVNNFDNIISIVDNIKRIDVSVLDGIVEEFDKVLHDYQKYTNISEDRIRKLCIILNRQINKLKKLAE